jgi:hypothetical protein
MRAREELMKVMFGDDIKKFSNYFRRKIRFNGYGNRIVTDDGRSLPAMMMVVPEA